MLARQILGSGQTRGVSFQPFPNSSSWWLLISSIFLIRISCHKTTHTNGYYGAWPGWVVSISALPLKISTEVIVAMEDRRWHLRIRDKAGTVSHRTERTIRAFVGMGAIFAHSSVAHLENKLLKNFLDFSMKNLEEKPLSLLDKCTTKVTVMGLHCLLLSS